MQRILLVKTSSLGDVVHNFPAVTDIRRQLPNARIEWVVEEAYAPLVALHPAVDEVIPIAIRRWRRAITRRSTWREFADLRRRLGSRPYDRIIDAQGLVKSAWIARFAKGEHIGLSRQTAREPIAARFYETTFHVPENRHAVERNRTLIALALNLKTHAPIDYGLGRVREQSDMHSTRPYAVLLHGTARAEKEWPEGDWRDLGRFIEAQGLQVVLPWGSARENSRSQRLAECMTSATVPPRHPINDVAALLAAARLVVGVDTGLVHLGAALGVPTVAIFRGSDPILTGPVGPGRIAICGSKGQSPTVDEAIDAVGKILSQ